jgi:opacity protein-like surface antigen
MEERMKRNALLTLLSLVALATPAVNAKELSYSYFGTNYVNTELDAGPDDLSANGFGLYGSFALGDNGLYAYGLYDSLGDDIDGVDVDFNRLIAGLGYAIEVDERLHVLLEASYVDYDLDADLGELGSGEAGADGYRMNVGLRGLITDSVECIAKIGYANVEEEGFQLYDGAVGELGLRWRFAQAWSAGVSTEFVENETTYKVGLRRSF